MCEGRSRRNNDKHTKSKGLAYSQSGILQMTILQKPFSTLQSRKAAKSLQTNQLSRKSSFKSNGGGQDGDDTNTTKQQDCAWARWTAITTCQYPTGSSINPPLVQHHTHTPGKSSLYNPFLNGKGSFVLALPWRLNMPEEKQLLSTKRYNTLKKSGLLLNISSRFQVFPLLLAILLNRASPAFLPFSFPLEVSLLDTDIFTRFPF